MRSLLLMLSLMAMSSALFAQTPPIEPGVSQELARWRAARYSDVRYKLNLTLEKMSPVLKGTMELRVKVSEPPASAGGQPHTGTTPPIILDWRRIKGHEEKSSISKVVVNGKPVAVASSWPPAHAGGSDFNEHLIFRKGVVAGENVIKLDFTSPILTSGSAITRYVDKEDGSEYIYSLFVPSDASTAFPVFDQPDLKARFSLDVEFPNDWTVVANASEAKPVCEPPCFDQRIIDALPAKRTWRGFTETKPISTYVFAFAAGPFEQFYEQVHTGGNASVNERGSQAATATLPDGRVSARSSIYVRKSQAAKFKPHAAEVFRLNREAVKYFEQYFDYKFPFPKYDLVLIPEFPFGGMEHAGATFLRESSIIFPQEPTKNDLVSRATLIFHEAAHQWFGDTVTMRWFDDLWLKEGFATFTAYKALEKIMPSAHAWKVFYERIKQGAYQTDSTRGTTAIYQPIANLSAAKSAYGNIVYNKAPAFLRQAEFYLGEDKFQTAVRAFLKKHEFGNAGWEDLVRELEAGSGKELDKWADTWIKRPGLPTIRTTYNVVKNDSKVETPASRSHFPPIKGWVDTSQGLFLGSSQWGMKWNTYLIFRNAPAETKLAESDSKSTHSNLSIPVYDTLVAALPNYGDYGYGIFLLDEKSRDYVIKNIRREKDPFLRTMMWGALWDSVREGELDPRVFVELVVKVLSASSGGQTTPSAEAAATPPKTGGESEMQKPAREQGRNEQRPDHALANAQASASEEDESTVATLLGRTGTALNYYIHTVQKPAREQGRDEQRSDYALTNAQASATDVDLRSRVEDLLIERMRTAPTLGQRITYYRALLNIAASEKARGVLKTLLVTGGNLSGSEGAPDRSTAPKGTLPTGRVSAPATSASVPGSIPLKTKDRFDIVTRLLILNDPEAPKLLAELEKTETSDDAKRYAYAARAGIGTAENKAKYWKDFTENKDIPESWIEAAFGPWNSIRHSELTLPYLQKALQELPNHKRNRKIFFVNGWLGAFIGGQRSEEALGVVNKFLADNPKIDNDLRLKVLENVDIIERAVRIRQKHDR